MKLTAISIQGFRSFVQDIALHIPSSRGLYYVTGDNRVAPEVSPNGVGKSTIWDALSWCLYGKSTRNLQGPDLAHWDRENITIVSAELEIRGSTYTVTRAWQKGAKNVLTLQVGNNEPRAVEQSAIQDVVKLRHETFLSAVLISQFGTRFLDLKATPKLEAFSRVLGLDRWLECSARAKDSATDHRNKLQRLEQRKNHAERDKVAAVSGLETATHASENFEASRAQELARLQALVDRAEATKEATEQALATKRQARADTQAWCNEAQAWIAGEEQRLGKLCEEQRSQESARNTLDADITQVARQMLELKGLGDQCPMCLGRVDKPMIAGVVQTLEAALDEKRILRAQVDADLSRTQDAIRQKNQRIADRRAGLRTKQKVLDGESREVSRLEERVRGYADSIARDTANRDAKAAAPDPSAQDQAKHKASMVVAAAKIAALDDQIQKHERLQSLAEFWQSAFKDLRLWVCEQAMAEFEAVMSSAMEQLGLRGWEVRVDIEGENKSGKITRGYTVAIRSPQSGESWVPWEAWCGGETARLALAGEMAFSEVACSRAGIDLGFEIWDEPTKHLSAGGVRDLVACLSERARRMGRQVFLVDHVAIDSGAFAGSYTVVLDEKGSHIESDITTRRTTRCDQYTSTGTTKRRYVNSLTTEAS